MTIKGVESDPADVIDGVPDAVRYVLAHPEDVLTHPRLTLPQKRALLASWASDRHAVEGAPQLRQLESGAVVRLETILDALRALDRAKAPAAPGRFARRPAFRLLRRRWPLGRDAPQRPDDDPPPPRPVRMRLAAAA